MQDFGTVIDGASRSDNIQSGGLPLDMELETTLLDPDAYPFEMLTRTINAKVPTEQMLHQYRERRPIPSFCKVTTAAAAGATTIVVDDYTRIKINYFIFNPVAKEMLLATALPASSNVTVVGGSAGTGGIANAIAANTTLIVLGESHAEGDEVPEASSNDSVMKFNYVMQKDKRVQVTDIEEAISHYDTSEKRKQDQRLAWIEYKIQQNLLYYIGIGNRESASSGSGRRHCCSGIIERLTENPIDLSPLPGNSFTLAMLTNCMSKLSPHSSAGRKKIGIFGVNAWNSMSQWPVGSLRVTPDATKWGIRLNTVFTGFGDLDVVYDNVLNANYGLDDRFFILDMKYIRQLYLRGLGVKMYEKIPNLSGIHQTVDAISGTFGLQVKLEELHLQGWGVK